MARVLGISCSLRKGSNSEILVTRALEAAQESGAETELVSLLGKNIAPCDGCYACVKTGICHIKDDMQEILSSIDGADAIIFGTPVYFWTLPGLTKVLMDRLYPLYTKGKLANKVGAVIGVASNMGQDAVWQVFNNFFCHAHMLAADFVNAFARERGEVRRDRFAMQAARDLGKQVVDLAACQFRYPEAYPVAIYRLVKERHGISPCPAAGRCEQPVTPDGRVD